MSEPKKQHYVPQTYLRKFSFSDGSVQKIFSLHKDQSKIICTNIRDTAAERHFYTIKKSDDQYIWENIYAKEIEPLMSNILSQITSQCENELIQDYSFVLTQEMKKQLSITMIFQLLRGRQSREFQRNIYSEVVLSVIKDVRERFLPIDETKEKILKAAIEEDDYFKLASMQATFDIKRLEKYINILIRKCFLVYRIIDNAEFITSDNPVMCLDALSLSAKPFNNGLAQNTTVIYFPVTSRLLIAAYDSSFYLGMLSEYDKRIIFLDSCKDQPFIKMQNQKQYEQCFNQVYAKRKEVLEELY
ncbi:DUF4238 domain-containing protein [Lacrimispora sp. BS-2]|uniref:DUF4238 domain-containing protein n=1 Tax=Lacrimispora sp. BS-2 TaxID=3151850 RepID=A0AAU7PPT1_9FIRM